MLIIKNVEGTRKVVCGYTTSVSGFISKCKEIIGNDDILILYDNCDNNPDTYLLVNKHSGTANPYE